jgi:hypothetical protein
MHALRVMKFRVQKNRQRVKGTKKRLEFNTNTLFII